LIYPLGIDFRPDLMQVAINQNQFGDFWAVSVDRFHTKKIAPTLIYFSFRIWFHPVGGDQTCYDIFRRFHNTLFS